uniref:late histone H2B.L4-like n=1 Tax=Odobenus rosmarus divergens TaxID=9708 RepID=UPI00063C7C09
DSTSYHYRKHSAIPSGEIQTAVLLLLPRKTGQHAVSEATEAVIRVLRHVHKGLSPLQKTMSVMDSFVKDIFEHIADEASRLACSHNRSTITSREIQTAVRLLLPGEIGKHAVSAATKSIIRYTFRQ